MRVMLSEILKDLRVTFSCFKINYLLSMLIRIEVPVYTKHFCCVCLVLYATLWLSLKGGQNLFYYVHTILTQSLMKRIWFEVKLQSKHRHILILASDTSITQIICLRIKSEIYFLPVSVYLWYGASITFILDFSHLWQVCYYWHHQCSFVFPLLQIAKHFCMDD